LLKPYTNVYLPPFPRAPFDRTIQYIAVSSVGGRWLRTHVIWNGHCFAGAVCHLVDTGNVTCLYTNTARAHAIGEFAIIPPAGAHDDAFIKKDRTETRVVTLIKTFLNRLHMQVTNFYENHVQHDMIKRLFKYFLSMIRIIIFLNISTKLRKNKN
jgi:hypothetical protein